MHTDALTRAGDALVGLIIDMVVIQKALESDADLLRLAARSAFLDDEMYKPASAIAGGPPGHDTTESHARWIGNHDYYKCIIDGNIAGGCIVKKHPSHYELLGIFLHSSYIGKGIGSEFLCGVMKRYPNAARWSLETPDYAKRNHRFYEHNGFIKSKKLAPDPSLGYAFIIYQKPAQPGAPSNAKGRAALHVS